MSEWIDEWIAKGFPWCDTCSEAAVFSESFGNLHSTPAFPYGLPPNADLSAHKVTMKDWSEAGRWDHAR